MAVDKISILTMWTPVQPTLPLVTLLFIYVCVSHKLIGRLLSLPFTVLWMLKFKHLLQSFQHNM